MTETTRREREPAPEERQLWLAEARKHDAEADVFAAEARQARAEAAQAEHGARVSEITLAREELKRAKELVEDEFRHVYRFVGVVSDETVKACIKTLTTWSRLDPECDITLIFFSPGGSIIPGFALYDFLIELREAGHHLTTVGRGYAASMAGILLQAGDVRVMGAESWLLIHEASFGAVGDFGAVTDTVKWVERMQDRILDIFAARSNLTKRQLKHRWHRQDWWISSDEALKHGLIDEIR